MPETDPIRPFLDHQGVVILDGGLATELEARGADLGDELWSARLLLEDPELLRRVHLDYLEAGADCITAASYQATFEGLARRGVEEAEAEELLRSSVAIARRARDEHQRSRGARPARLRPLVAASVGPYGAYLADGSEYTGDYHLDEAALADFHRRRFRVLAASGADLLACETLPCRREARALVRLLRESPWVWAWLTFSCRDGRRLADGTDFAAAVADLDGEERVVAVGVNCTPPRFVPELIAEARRVTGKPIVVYPNSGEPYDPRGKRWLEPPAAVDFGAEARRWHEAGASLIGGCCRTGPGDVRRVRQALLGQGGYGG